eukprot:m.132125 g.132125  ORF g.132125 m.132125 type:complete len:696 (+) comp14640_c0_seq6:187-2274(+)
MANPISRSHLCGDYDHGSLSVQEAIRRLLKANQRLGGTTALWLVYSLPSSDEFPEQRLVLATLKEALWDASSHTAVLQYSIRYTAEDSSYRLELPNGSLTSPSKNVSSLMQKLNVPGGILPPIGTVFVARDAKHLWDDEGISNYLNTDDHKYECMACFARYDEWNELLTHMDTKHESTRRMYEDLQCVLPNAEEVYNPNVDNDGVHASKTNNFMEIKRKYQSRRRDKLPSKIIERLDVMLYKSPTSKQGQKEFERSLVEWTSDKDVPMCPDCGEAFRMSKRKHHCRTCGGILCQSCSLELSTEDAKVIHKQAQRTSLGAAGHCNRTSKIRICQNCLQLAKGEERQAAAFRKIWTLRKLVKEKAESSVSMYEVLFRELEVLKQNARKFFDLGSRLRQGEAVSRYEEAKAIREAVIAKIPTICALKEKTTSAQGGGMCRYLTRENLKKKVTQDLSAVLYLLLPLESGVEKPSLRFQQDIDLEQGCFEIWQHERRGYSGAFSSNTLTDADLPAWGSDRGDWGYEGLDSVNPKGGNEWAGPWVIDRHRGDEDGWEYADDFTPSVDAWDIVEEFEAHNVRRRRWLRKMVLVDRRERSQSGGAGSNGIPRASPLNSRKGNNGEKKSGSSLSKRETETELKAKTCSICEKAFTKIRRRHLCRHCGKPVCGHCSKSKREHEQYKENVRTCDVCVTQIDQMSHV